MALIVISFEIIKEVSLLVFVSLNSGAISLFRRKLSRSRMILPWVSDTVVHGRKFTTRKVDLWSNCAQETA